MANTNASVKKKNTRNTVLRVLLYVVIIAICLITLYPYFVTVCTALKSRAEIFSMNGTIFPVETTRDRISPRRIREERQREISRFGICIRKMA